MPPNILSRVDFPAPFSPTKACTIPGSAENVTRSSAHTPGKRLVISIRRRELLMNRRPTRPLFSEAELGSDILLVLSIHQFTAGEGKFRWLLILRDPVVHVDRSFVAMSFGANKNRTKETGHSRFVELVQRRLSTTDSYPDHFVCAKPSSLSGSHRSEHRLVVESERNPLLKSRILSDRAVCGIKRVLSIRFGRRSLRSRSSSPWQLVRQNAIHPGTRVLLAALRRILSWRNRPARPTGETGTTHRGGHNN